MMVSATTLGRSIGVTAQEMNRILIIKEYIKGKPKEYEITEKGSKFVQENFHHSGPGGYHSYNADWSVFVYDESILDDMDITKDLIEQVRMELKTERKQKAQERKLYQEEAERNFIESLKNSSISKNNDFDVNIDKNIVLKYAFITGLIASSGYALYKIIPKIKNKYISNRPSDVTTDKEEKHIN